MKTYFLVYCGCNKINYNKPAWKKGRKLKISLRAYIIIFEAGLLQRIQPHYFPRVFLPPQMQLVHILCKQCSFQIAQLHKAVCLISSLNIFMVVCANTCSQRKLCMLCVGGWKKIAPAGSLCGSRTRRICFSCDNKVELPLRRIKFISYPANMGRKSGNVLFFSLFSQERRSRCNFSVGVCGKIKRVVFCEFAVWGNSCSNFGSMNFQGLCRRARYFAKWMRASGFAHRMLC